MASTIRTAANPLVVQLTEAGRLTWAVFTTSYSIPLAGPVFPVEVCIVNPWPAVSAPGVPPLITKTPMIMSFALLVEMLFDTELPRAKYDSPGTVELLSNGATWFAPEIPMTEIAMFVVPLSSVHFTESPLRAFGACAYHELALG